MDSQKNHLRHVMLHCFEKGSNVKNTADEICTIYGRGTTTIRNVHNWFTKFRSGNFYLKDENRRGRPATTDTDLIKSMLSENPRYGVREIVNTTKIPRTMVHNQQHEKNSFLKRLATGNATWILYQNVLQKRT
ncbi:histone-lysine N-methyltransferase SETMAR-like [Vespa crabro]|uniref:histone-lysine N-methyltransferase SETMAR-like n=1 Tax=Vespa crabro TaxID=7445 RepID=UPI001F01F48E|nr:histone-lysine N-methyltransferase SETMAR-like [Vespa crabro]